MKNDPDFDYPKDTIGYHWRFCRAVFGPVSKPTKWLEEKAANSANGMLERVVAHETQVFQILGQIFLKEMEDKE